ncbi:MAG: hypothetical protein IK012_00870 [Fibrobacter sp.]|uniref:hypothetical protein n=1 Tax=Fibrobacter sp. TaxID=35828 RepID=UPI0025C040ED|nr:hypothetical protein [Fibrobacter sp.]MBR4783796.1 hypothetical protein [Fibrobacter sp.]
MEETKNRSIADTFNAKLKTPWVWLIILLTLGLTGLFYVSQKPDLVVYSRHIKSLSDYQLMEMELMRYMANYRVGYAKDSTKAISQSMSLRELAVSFAGEMDDFSARGFTAPPSYSVHEFERRVLSKVAAIRRYLPIRRVWLDEWDRVYAEVSFLPGNIAYPLQMVLDSARFGFPVEYPQGLEAPDSLAQRITQLLNENVEHSHAWIRFDDHETILSGEELIQFFQQESMNEIALKAKIPLVFYFLTLVLLLSTFFFIFRSKT